MTWTFLLNNGYSPACTEDEAYDFAMSAAAGSLQLEDIATWFAGRLRSA